MAKSSQRKKGAIAKATTTAANAARRQLARRTKRTQTDEFAERRELLASSTPYLGLVHAPLTPQQLPPMGDEVRVASYNVHRWTGINGRAAPDPARAAFVISELGADIIALQEVLRPFGAEDPLARLANALHLYAAFGVTRIHTRGELGNAILSRWPVKSAYTVDLTFSRIERRAAVVVQIEGERDLSVVATHLALVDRTRRQQVKTLLELPQIRDNPVVLVGDMNAWRRCKATRELDRELDTAHHNRAWPLTFPSTRPMLALDRIYAQDAKVIDLRAHATAASHRASDHLPIVARVSL